MQINPGLFIAIREFCLKVMKKHPFFLILSRHAKVEKKRFLSEIVNTDQAYCDLILSLISSVNDTNLALALNIKELAQLGPFTCSNSRPLHRQAF